MKPCARKVPVQYAQCISTIGVGTQECATHAETVRVCVRIRDIPVKFENGFIQFDAANERESANAGEVSHIPFARC